jgi:hypothetical protein
VILSCFILSLPYHCANSETARPELALRFKPKGLSKTRAAVGFAM